MTIEEWENLEIDEELFVELIGKENTHKFGGYDW